MSVTLYVALALCLTVVAFVVSILGIGGGVFYTPIQIFFGIGIHEAAATSLFLIIILSISATSVYRRAGKVDWRMAIMLELFSVAGGLSGGYLSDFIPQNLLMALLTVTIIVAGISMLRQRLKLIPHALQHKHWYLWHREACGERYSINLIFALPLSFIAGAIGAMVGIGGGVIKVPMMVLLFGVPMDIAIATSGFMVGITAGSGFVGHLFAGHWNWTMSLILAPGVFFGAQIGSRTMLHMDRELLKKAFGIIMFLIAAGLIIKACY
ncbi:MAG: sulfite exporter TauE/SafE family protein [Pseudomonadota bacterium]